MPKDKKPLNKPRSVIEKWLHYDRDFTPLVVRDVLHLDTYRYDKLLSNPSEHLTIKKMETLAALLGKDIIEVFFAAYRKPYSEISHDLNAVKLNDALEQLGIK
jgi:hypothetical protein